MSRHAMTHEVKVWDPVVRVFHWATATLFLANATIIPEDGLAHIYIGYAVLGLVLVRLVWGVIGTRYARFSAFPPSISAAREHAEALIHRRRDDLHLSHNPLGALMIYNMLATLILISITGLMADSNAFWGVEWVKDLHEIVVNYMLWCVGLHVFGVLFESRLSGINLVHAMWTGRKNIPGHGR